MIHGIESVLLFSEDAKKLAAFYREKVGLKVTFEGDMGEHKEEIFGFEMKKGSGFSIIDHSKVKGKNKGPERIIINFEVDKIEPEVKRLVAAGVKLVTDIYHVQEYGKIATFEDIDGNYFQLVQVHS